MAVLARDVGPAEQRDAHLRPSSVPSRRSGAEPNADGGFDLRGREVQDRTAHGRTRETFSRSARVRLRIGQFRRLKRLAMGSGTSQSTMGMMDAWDGLRR